jgi:hypothetical protein
MAPVAGGKPAAYAMDAFIEACSGATGAIVSKCVSYPLDLMKTLLASAGPNDTAVGIVTDIVRTKGIIGLYVGIGPKLTKSGVQKFLFFYVYDALLRLFRNLQGTAPNTFWNVIIGFVADFLGAPFVVPLDFITTQVQTTKTGEGTWAIVQRTMKEDGIWKFWDGFSGYVAGSWQPAVQFTFYGAKITVLSLKTHNNRFCFIADQLKAMYLKAMKKASTDDSHASESGLVLAPALTAFEAFTLGAGVWYYGSVLSQLQCNSHFASRQSQKFFLR